MRQRVAANNDKSFVITFIFSFFSREGNPAQLAPLGRADDTGALQRLLDGLVEVVASVRADLFRVHRFVPVLEQLEDDDGDVCGSHLVLETAEERDADGGQPVLASDVLDDTESLLLRAPARLTVPLGHPGREWIPEHANCLRLPDDGSEAAVMEDHRARLQCVPVVAIKRVMGPARAEVTGFVDRCFSPPVWHHALVQVL
jgi:hypothetical protein